MVHAVPVMMRNHFRLKPGYSGTPRSIPGLFIPSSWRRQSSTTISLTTATSGADWYCCQSLRPACRPAGRLSETSCSCQLMMVVGIVILCWTTMVVSSRSSNASHIRSTELLLLWQAVVLSLLLVEDWLYYCNGRSIVLLEHQLYHWKMNCCVERSSVLLEDQLYYWKINCDVGRSVVLLEDQL